VINREKENNLAYIIAKYSHARTVKKALHGQVYAYSGVQRGGKGAPTRASSLGAAERP